MNEELERILLGWDTLKGVTVVAPNLTHAELDTLAAIYGRGELLTALKKYQDSTISMSTDETIDYPQRKRYGKDIERLQKRIEYVRSLSPDTVTGIKFSTIKYRGYVITGQRGEWHAYAGGEDINKSTIEEVKHKIDALEFGGIAAHSRRRPSW